MNLPNILSLSRIVLVPLFIYLLVTPDVNYRIGALIVFIIASLTDFMDGWTARKLGLESELGKFLDPLADKLMVIATLVALVRLDPFFPLWMVGVIVARDLLITFMRYIAINRGRSLKTSSLGKLKTAAQMGAILIIIVIMIIRKPVVRLKASGIVEMMNSNHPDKFLLIAPYWLMFIVTILTAISGFHYLKNNWQIFLPARRDKDEKK